MQEGKSSIEDCSTCERDSDACQFCPVITGEQPTPDLRVEFYLNLWRRVRRYEQLPDAGGLLDQEERLMKILDYIQDVVDEREKQRRKREEAQAAARARQQQARGRRL